MGVVFQQIVVVSRNPLFEMLPPNPVVMRRKLNAVLLFLVLSLALTSPLISTSSARSVHETTTYDLFPQGDLTDSGQWTVGATTSFTSQLLRIPNQWSQINESRWFMNVHKIPIRCRIGD